MSATFEGETAVTTYLLRIRRVANSPCELEDPRTCEARSFASLEVLFRFLSEASSPTEPDRVLPANHSSNKEAS